MFSMGYPFSQLNCLSIQLIKNEGSIYQHCGNKFLSKAQYLNCMADACEILGEKHEINLKF